MYEFFEHTADLGLRVRAPDLESLFVDAARGLFAMIVENPDAVRALTTVSVELGPESPDYLLFDWLNELLAAFDTRHLVFSRFEVTLPGGGLSATASGVPLDPERHRPAHEVKAITYHGLRVERAGRGWEAEVIVDI